MNFSIFFLCFAYEKFFLFCFFDFLWFKKKVLCAYSSTYRYYVLQLMNKEEHKRKDGTKRTRNISLKIYLIYSDEILKI